MRGGICLAIVSVMMAAGNLQAAADEYAVHVGDGQALDQALADARAHRKSDPDGQVTVILDADIYLTHPVRVTDLDSGNRDAPFVLEGNGHRISGGHLLELKRLSQGDPAFSGFNAQARQSLCWADLSNIDLALGGLPAVFNGAERLMPSRWPASGFISSPEGGSGGLKLMPGQADIISGEGALRVSGYFGNTWFWQTLKGKSTGDEVVMEAPKYGFSKDGRYYFSNIAKKLNGTHSFYYDDASRRLYVDCADKSIRVPDVVNVLTVSKAKYIVLRDLSFEMSISDLVRVEDSDNVQIENCYAGRSGENGISVNGGSNNQVSRCYVSDIGKTGISIVGGDRKNLTPSGNGVSNSVITGTSVIDRTYHAGVNLSGVGNYLKDSEISNVPHEAVSYSGNDNVISGNRIHDAVQETADAGAVYSGGDWTSRGNILSGNYIYNITSHVNGLPVVAIYLDDQLSGTIVSDNIVVNADLPILLGGGRDNRIIHNVFLGYTKSAISIDARGTTWETSNSNAGKRLVITRDAVPYASNVYDDRYPGIGASLQSPVWLPTGNRVEGNIFNGPLFAKFDSDSTQAYFPNWQNQIRIGMASCAPTKCLYQISTSGAVLDSTRSAISNLNRTASILADVKSHFSAQ